VAIVQLVGGSLARGSAAALASGLLALARKLCCATTGVSIAHRISATTKNLIPIPFGSLIWFGFLKELDSAISV
jgi:hypothetical protein